MPVKAFARTCFLYYILCLCKSLKELATKGLRFRVTDLPETEAAPLLRVQRYNFSAFPQNYTQLFSNK